MIKDAFAKLPFTAIIISYFFVCGGLYLIGFWTTFEIDISSFITITDIPKSFIFPFVITQGFLLLYIMVNLFTSHDLLTERPFLDYETDKLWKRFIKFLVSFDFLFTISIPYIVTNFQDNKLNPIFWSLCCFWISFYLIRKVSRSPFLKTQIQEYNLRLYLSYFLCFVPIGCFSTGKVLSLVIFNNSKIQYVNIDNKTPKIDSTSLKFISFLGDKLIVSSLDNKKINYINQSSYSKVELLKK